ncbi:MAG: FAD-dependent oxidoreductase [Planctomycetes bacterium]|nr:FAD-dependent oxidoreductase [Planctomycetota bacterium]
MKTDILIVGGGTGGCAAAMSAASLGFRVVITEEMPWLGGQLTSQAVPSDEHPWIEWHGCTARYRRFREALRQHYRDHYPLLPAARDNPHLNPGGGSVSRITCEPRAAVAAIGNMLAFDRMRGRVTVLYHRRPVGAEVRGDVVRSVELLNTQTGGCETIEARYILDATELGELLPLCGAEYVTGSESRGQTGEAHAPEKADPQNMQAITWCFPLAFDPTPGANHAGDPPAEYRKWHDYVPAVTPPWAGRLLAHDDIHPITLKPRRVNLFPDKPGAPCWWRYRKIVTRDHYPADLAPHEVTLVNWPLNDYFQGSIIDQPAEVVAQRLRSAKQLSLSLLHWLQTECPRPEDGGTGYPGLYIPAGLMGSDDGLALAPYIRESRRIRALFTVTENHVGTEARGGHDIRSLKPRPASFNASPRAERFPDSVGVGCYRIDLHPSTGGDNYVDISSLPFQIPLGSLLPVRLRNLLPACKNLGVTHITNGCYRLHPVEWNIGESAGLLAAFCLSRNTEPYTVRATPDLLKEFQSLLIHQGVELEWPEEHPV